MYIPRKSGGNDVSRNPQYPAVDSEKPVTGVEGSSHIFPTMCPSRSAFTVCPKHSSIYHNDSIGVMNCLSIRERFYPSLYSQDLILPLGTDQEPCVVLAELIQKKWHLWRRAEMVTLPGIIVSLPEANCPPQHDSWTLSIWAATWEPGVRPLWVGRLPVSATQGSRFCARHFTL